VTNGKATSMNVFNEDYLYFDDTSRDPKRAADEACTIVAMLGLAPNARVLDVACGVGRISNALASRGYRVTGIDTNEQYLALAVARACGLRHPPHFETRDMRALNFNDAFDAAILWSGSFGFFSDEENAAVVAGMAAAVRPRGMVLIEQPSRWYLLRHWQPIGIRRRGADMLVEERTYDPDSECSCTTRTIIRDGVVRTSTFTVRLFGWPEIRTLMQASGLIELPPLAESGGVYDCESRRLIARARKPDALDRGHT
jgi:2-polyprenyl-3-methyl-5-hydroxy-6-metoxy-1,4-benzoquinol methylase